MSEKKKTNIENQISFIEKNEFPRIDAAIILANLSNSSELSEAQNSLQTLQSAIAFGNKTELAKILACHATLLDALFKRLLSDASSCKSERLTATVLELALKTADTTRKTVIATSELISIVAPVVAVQINNV